MRPGFFKLTLWNDPQKGAKRPAEWGACHGANRACSVHAASVEQALANGWRCAGRCAWPGREAGRRGALCEPICRLRGRGSVC